MKPIFGIDTDHIIINDKKAIAYLNHIQEAAPDFLSEFQENQKDNDPDYTFSDWMECYTSDENNNTGIAAFIADCIQTLYHIDVTSEDQYVGIYPKLPWNFSPETKILTETEYYQILSDVINNITDTILTIQWIWLPDNPDD